MSYSPDAPRTTEFNATPSGHRTRLGSALPSAIPQVQGSTRTRGFFPTGSSHGHTPPLRRPLNGINGNAGNRSGTSGYGMSAGIKVGKPNGTVSLPILHTSGKPC